MPEKIIQKKTKKKIIGMTKDRTKKHITDDSINNNIKKSGMKKIIIGILILGIIILVSFFGYKIYKIIEYNNLPIWEKKIQTEQDIKIGIITDTHVHAKRINRQNESTEAPRYLSEKNVKPIRNFVKQMKKFQPKFIIHLGDVIEGTNDKDFVGIKGLELVKKELIKVGVPVYWVLGNHDLRSVNRNQFKEALGIEKLNQVFDIGDYRFIILDANYDEQDRPHSPGENTFIPGKITPETMKWFEQQLQTDKQVFVFIHQGVFTHLVKSDEHCTKQSILNAQDFQNLLHKYHVKGVFNGHMESRYFEKSGGTEIFSLTGSKKSKKYPDSYYELTIIKGEPNLKMFYTTEDSGDEIIEIDFKTGPESKLAKEINEKVRIKDQTVKNKNVLNNQNNINELQKKNSSEDE